MAMVLLAIAIAAPPAAAQKMWMFPPGASCPSSDPPTANIAGGAAIDTLIKNTKEDKNCAQFQIWCIDGSYFGLRYIVKNAAGVVVTEKWVGICPYEGGINSCWVCVMACPGGGFSYTGSKYKSRDGGADDDGDGNEDSVEYCFTVGTCTLDGTHREDGVADDTEQWGPNATRMIPGDPNSTTDGPLELLNNMPSEGALDPCTSSPSSCPPTNPTVATGGTTGVPGTNDYTVNGLGSGTTSINTIVLPPNASSLMLNMNANPGDVVIPVEGTPAPGAFPVPGGLYSLEVFPLSILLDPFTSLGGISLMPILTVPSSGNWFLGFSTNEIIGFTSQIGLLSASAPFGIATSQVHSVEPNPVNDPNLVPGTGAACNPSGTPLPLGDDTFMQVPLGFAFPYYGTAYSAAFVGSNGFVTFGAGNADFTETVLDLLTQPPRIAVYWDDFNPGAGGNVSFFTDNVGQAEVCFLQVPEFGTANANSFRCRFGPGLINNDYGAMAAVDGLVGCSPGFNIDPIGTPINLSAGPNTGWAPGSAVYELFGTNDLAGFQLFWMLDANGNPIAQN